MEPRIYTNQVIDQSPTWQRVATVLPFVDEGEGRSRPVNAFRNAMVAQKSITKNDILILTNTHNLSGSIYGLLNTAGNGRPTIIRTEPLLTRPKTRMLSPAKVKYIKAALRPVDRLIVWAPTVIDRYERNFGIPREKMFFQPFHHTLTGFNFSPPACGDYIFSGGDSMRDYERLIAAVDGLKMRVVIATRVPLPRTLRIPENVTVKAVTPAEFRELMAGAYAVVFPLRMDDIRTSGQQSFLNAMALGKAVVVTDTLDAPHYIEHEKTGLLTPFGDTEKLREVIKRLLDQPDLVRSLGDAAREVALPMDQEFTYNAILKLAFEVHERRMRSAKNS